MGIPKSLKVPKLLKVNETERRGSAQARDRGPHEAIQQKIQNNFSNKNLYFSWQIPRQKK
jgi:hypothetical protein